MQVTRTDGSTLEYLSAAETAKLIRKALAKAFPGTKFYVRSETYSGGSSIDVYYDGATLGPDGHALLVDVDYDGKPTGLPWDGPQYGRAGHLPKPGAPPKKAVQAIVDGFAGRGFDGMIDLAYSIDTFLDADGFVVGTESTGTEGSRGSVPAWSSRPATFARRVKFAGGYVFVNDELPYDVRTKGGAA